MENASMKEQLNLNLGSGEFHTAVSNQPKPLIIPLCAELPLSDISPLDVYTGTQSGYGFLLESMEGSEKIARYSYIGINPELVISVSDRVDLAGCEPYISIAEDPQGDNPVDQIKSILSRINYVNVKAPRFFGGLVGYFAYDCVYSLFPKVREGVPDIRKGADHEDYLARFMLARDCIVFDHTEKKLYVFSSPFLTYDSDIETEYQKNVVRIGELTELITTLAAAKTAKPTGSGSSSGTQDYRTSVPQDSYEKSVERVREHIAAGDIFQAVISRKMECDLNCSPFSVYAAMREINPSPYMYYLDFGDEKVIGASPEMLVRVEKRRVTTVPIAGTRPRGSNAAEDARLGHELLQDEKERAEHTMLVDLARNDLGRVCRFGTVEVSEFMGIEKFSHVQHIVSTVNGVLRDNLDCYDAFKSCFPAGTVSGAPKTRAMQIIDEEEPENRGIYAGAIGYIGFDRNLEFAIAIRTVVVKNGRASVQVGAGIVADSIPENEWIETANKAAAMIRALDRAGVNP